MDTFAEAARRGRAFSLITDEEHEEKSEELVVSASTVSALEPLEATQAYVRDFLAKPNPNLGRKGVRSEPDRYNHIRGQRYFMSHIIS